MSFLELKNINKTYSSAKALNEVSFTIPAGSIFGLLGPNGAGKTTLIRILTNILKPDSGTILLNNNNITNATLSSIGYLPEERGLYKKMKVGEQLIYLARLKDLSPKEAREKVSFWMEKLGIASWWTKKIEELSKGMQQKVQFIAAVVHSPKLLILDEPFTGLDPINSNQLQNEIFELRDKGTTIVLSTHRMEQVEEICEHIVLINKGRVILSGGVKSLQEQFKKNEFKIIFTGSCELHEDAPFETLSVMNGTMIVRLKENKTSNDILKYFINNNINITSFHEILPSINQIFISQVNS